MFGLAAVAAVAAMAFLGAGTATATNSTHLCKKPAQADLKCPTGEAATEVHGIATEPLLDSSAVNVKCESSLAKATLGVLGSPQIALITDLTWTNCKTHGGTNCTVTTLLKGLLKILKLSSSDAHVTGVPADANHTGTTVLVECGVFIHCSYEATASTTLLALPLTGSEVAILHAKTAVTASTTHDSFFCPKTSEWLALYASLTATDVHFAS
jgi:hypothetical protein